MNARRVVELCRRLRNFRGEPTWKLHLKFSARFFRSVKWLLELLKNLVRVVAVCGAPSHGKSFLLNLLLGRTSGFQLGSTRHKGTEGIWMWSDLVKRTTSNETEYSLILFDSEGIRPADFFHHLLEEDMELTPHEYMERVLRSSQGNEMDVARYNKLDQLEPNFRAEIDALTEFVFERTRPKQVGYTVMTGPILIGITGSYLDSLNNGLEATISSWQSVEEAECKKAFESAAETYLSNINRSKPHEKTALRKAQKEAVQKSFEVYNASAVGAGAARKNYEKLLRRYVENKFKDYKRKISGEAELRCSKAIQSMEMRLKAACQSLDANVDNAVEVLGSLLIEYKASYHGSKKGQKLAMFLKQSLEGLISDLVKRLMDQIKSKKLHNRQLENVESYDDAINEHTSYITHLQGANSPLEKKFSTLLKIVDSLKCKICDCKRTYDILLREQKPKEDEAVARLVALKEQVMSAQEEVEGWKSKLLLRVREKDDALEKVAFMEQQEEEFYNRLVEKEEEVNDKASKIECAKQCLTKLRLELKAAKSKIESYEVKVPSLKLRMEEWRSKDGEKGEAPLRLE